MLTDGKRIKGNIAQHIFISRYLSSLLALISARPVVSIAIYLNANLTNTKIGKTQINSSYVSVLKSFFLQGGFSYEDAEQIASVFVYKTLDKGGYFVEEGKTSKHLGFIENGFFQYYINLDGEEKTTYSLGANNLIASLVSFLKGVPSKENIRAAVTSAIWMVSKDDFRKLQQTIPSFKDYYIGVLEWQICCIEESRLDGIMLSAGQRYEKMLFKEPDMIRQIPVQYLASIIGVTPRHLSRIRNTLRLAN